MKKSYLMIAAAAAMFAACSNNDTFKEVDNQDVAIGFDGKYVNKATRAEINEAWFQTSGKHFGVYGYKGESFALFTNEDVSWNGSDWVHTTVRFWDKNATDYNFYAHAPRAAAHTFTNKKYTFTSIPVITEINTGDPDIVVATPITAMGYGNCTHTDVNGHGEGHVEFDFNHILSKLAFKVKTSVPSSAAEITVTEVKLDFPTGAATWAQANADAVAGTTTYSSYTAKDGIGNDGKPILANFETAVFSGTTAALTSTGVSLVDATNSSNVGNTFIVTPVAVSPATTGLEHVFGVKVTYNIQYKKLNPAYATDNTVEQYINDGDPETDCIATGVIGGGNTTATQYKPAQNSSYIITIDVNPAQIQFCVDNVIGWDTDITTTEGEVK